MKMIFQNLLAQRKRNLWLLLEMTVITIITWVVLDPVMVLLTMENMPQGYEPERMVYVAFAKLKNTSPKYSEEYADSAGVTASYNVLANHIKDIEGVESLTRAVIGDNSTLTVGIQVVNEEGDTVPLSYSTHNIIPESDFFTTFGIEAVDGSPSATELSRRSFTGSECVITESLAKRIFGECDNYIGRSIKSAGYNGEGDIVVGIVKNVRPREYEADCNIAWTGQYMNVYDMMKYSSRGSISIRLKPGYTPEQWVKDNKEEMLSNFKFGNFYVKSVMTYSQMGSRTTTAIKADSEKHIKYALLLFFLVNLALGVAGTYYLQTRSRSHDAGLMKAYGSTGRRVFGMLVGEAMIVTVLGWIIGCFAYLHYALKEGVSSGLETGIDVFPTDCWVSDFSTHFIVVSLAVLVVLAVIVLIGVSFPARRIARVNPVDALRDE